MVGNMSIKKYIRLWWLMTSMVSQNAFVSRFGAIIFILGKILRFASFLFFLIILLSRTHALVNYNIWQIIFFYTTFNLVDSFAQFFLREVYRFRTYVISGDFDYILTKPIPTLFRILFGGSDALDIPMLLISIAILVFSIGKIGNITTLGVFLYLSLLINGFIIAFSFHILVISIGILTAEVDNALWLYRDLTAMGRLPIDIYKDPMRFLITFVIPVGIMMTFPAKALFGILSAKLFFLSVIVGLTLLYLSLRLWKFSLKNYTSASS